MKKNCISRFLAFIKRVFRLWRTVQRNSTFVECEHHQNCSQLTIHVNNGIQDAMDEETLK